MAVSRSDRSLVLVALAVFALISFAVVAVGQLAPDELRKLAVKLGAASAAEVEEMTISEVYSSIARRLWSIGGQVVAGLLAFRMFGPLLAGTLGVASVVGMAGYAAVALGVLYATGNLDVVTNLARQGLTRDRVPVAADGCAAVGGVVQGGVCLGLKY